jgi:hypothetical protein
MAPIVAYEVPIQLPIERTVSTTRSTEGLGATVGVLYLEYRGPPIMPIILDMTSSL